MHGEILWRSNGSPTIAGGRTFDGRPWVFLSGDGGWSVHVGDPNSTVPPTLCEDAAWCFHASYPMSEELTRSEERDVAEERIINALEQYFLYAVLDNQRLD